MSNFVKLVTIPLSKELLSESIKNKDTVFLIDYSNSSFKNEKLFAYLNNLKLKYEIYFNNDISYKDFEDLIKTFLTTDVQIESGVLRYIVAEIILRYIGSKESPFELSVREDYLNRFIDTNKDILDKWVLFFDSTIVSIKKKYNDLDYSIKTIDDINYIGLNVVDLYLSEPFLVFYNSVDRTKKDPVYFVKQNTLTMFFNKPLLWYLDNYWNPLVKSSTLAITGHKY